MNQIAVSGSGSAAAPPDVVAVSVGVDIVAGSVAEARAKAATDASDIMSTLHSHGVEPGDVVTSSLSIHPDYDHREGRRLRGYRVTNTIDVTLHDLERVGPLIDAVAAISDSIVVNGVHFSHSDQAALESRAREAAWADARRKADELAALSGSTLGSVAGITEQAHAGSPVPMRAMAREAAGVATPIVGGELAVSVTIDVQFSI